MRAAAGRAPTTSGVSRVLSFGIYSDRPEYPRHANLLGGLREWGVEVLECRDPMAEDSAARLRSATSLGGALRFAAGLARSYVRLAGRFPRVPRVEAVLVGYPAWFHVHLARRLRRRFHPEAVLVQDVFFPLHEALVGDRGVLREGGLPARFVRAVERSSYLASDALLIDTAAHGDSLSARYSVPRQRVEPVWAGSTFPPAPEPVNPGPAGGPFRVVFVGTYIPLHGVEVILEAARRLRAEPGIRFEVVGSGQVRERVLSRCREEELANVAFRDWVAAGDLRDLYRCHDLGLGIFGTTEKAASVIPIKVFDLCAAGVPFVTADTPGVREAFRHGENAWLVPSGEPEALARAILHLRAHPELRKSLAHAGHRTARECFSPHAIGRQVLRAIEGARASRPGT